MLPRSTAHQRVIHLNKLRTGKWITMVIYFRVLDTAGPCSCWTVILVQAFLKWGWVGPWASFQGGRPLPVESLPNLNFNFSGTLKMAVSLCYRLWYPVPRIMLGCHIFHKGFLLILLEIEGSHGLKLRCRVLSGKSGWNTAFDRLTVHYKSLWILISVSCSFF